MDENYKIKTLAVVSEGERQGDPWVYLASETYTVEDGSVVTDYHVEWGDGFDRHQRTYRDLDEAMREFNESRAALIEG